jgi:hypothetical protein
MVGDGQLVGERVQVGERLALQLDDVDGGALR